uniref:Uncharacterized protein n=1 Tax=Capra hircus TaxID=9925 RepID=A0A8C2QZ86_CAPHI
MEIGETHLVPRLGYPPLAVWHPGCPTGRDRKLPPTLGSLPWHRPDLFSSLEQLPLSAGQRGLAPVCSRAGASARAPLTPSLPTQALVSPSFPTPPQEEEIPEGDTLLSDCCQLSFSPGDRRPS